MGLWVYGFRVYGILGRAVIMKEHESYNSVLAAQKGRFLTLTGTTAAMPQASEGDLLGLGHRGFRGSGFGVT